MKPERVTIKKHGATATVIAAIEVLGRSL